MRRILHPSPAASVHRSSMKAALSPSYFHFQSCQVVMMLPWVQARDRQRFGEAFGDRYCLLQLVTRQEMEVGRQNFSRNGVSSSSSGPSSSNGNGSGNGSGASPAQVTMMGPLGMLPPGGMPAVFPPAAAAAGMLFGMPGALPGMAAAPGLAGPLGAMPAAPAHMVAAGGMQMPLGGLGMGHGMVPAVPGQHPGLPPVNLAAAGALPTAAAAAAAGGVSWGGPAAARYMVQVRCLHLGQAGKGLILLCLHIQEPPCTPMCTCK